MCVMSRLVVAGLMVLGLLATTGAAEALPPPKGKVILRVTGNIADRNTPDAAEFDAAMLEGLGLTEMVTRTPWTEGEVHFSGISPKALLAALGARGTSLDAIALNDYRVEIPIRDVEQLGPLLAMRVDGRPLRIRDKGPLWLVYPWSDRPDLDTIEYHSRSIWQIKTLVVR
jgi:hypothetical protein